MKVLVVTAIYPSPDRPVTGTFVRTQVEWLRRAGVDTEVMVLSGRNRKLMYPRAMLQLRRRLHVDPVDVVHGHYGYVGVVCATQRSVPTVVTFHGDDVLGTVDERGVTRPFSRFAARINVAIGDRVDAAIVQTRAMARRFRRDDVHVIPHEVDFNVFRPIDVVRARAELGLEQDGRYLLFASPPTTAVKRYPLARAVSEALKRVDPRVQLLVVHRETQARLALYMNACDALIFPSYQEGSPNIVKQAMACNLPVVATDVGDVREVIEGTSGCAICEPTVEDLTRSLEKLLEAPRRTDGRKAVARFEGPLITRQLLELYEEVIDRRQSTGRRTRLSKGPRGGVRQTTPDVGAETGK